MQANFVDFRTRSKQIIAALRRNERITLMYRGKPAATIVPHVDGERSERQAVAEQPAFGMWADRDEFQDVPAYLCRLRRGRFDAD